MRATVQPSRLQFDSWLAGEPGHSRRAPTLGKQEFEGVCAKCHGLDGTGGIGPNDRQQRDHPENKDSLETIVRDGRNEMPAVGADWSEGQMDALFTYLTEEVRNGG